MKLQPGDYVELAGLTDQQVEAVIERGEDTGWAIKDERLIDNKYILFLENDYICFTFKHPIDLNLSYPVRQLTIEQVLGVQPSNDKNSKYDVEVNGTTLDVYDVLKAWNVTNPALQHLIKKALQAGNRGHKTLDQDMDDIVASAIRARELAK